MPQTISIARELARVHPGATLPCPVCAATLKAANLERHLVELHQVGSWRAPPSAPLELDGVDRRFFWFLLLPGMLWIVVVVAYLATHRGPLQDGDLFAGIIFVSLMVALTLPTLAALNRFRAQLVLDDARVELRYGWGRLRLALELPVALETGVLWENRPSAGMAQYEHGAHEKVDIGGYLRLTSAGRSLTVGCTKGEAPNKRWAPTSFHRGPKRRYWDITLDPVASVALEYHLAARNLLTPR
jgi:hypothetical protein